VRGGRREKQRKADGGSNLTRRSRPLHRGANDLEQSRPEGNPGSPGSAQHSFFLEFVHHGLEPHHVELAAEVMGGTPENLALGRPTSLSTHAATSSA